MSSLFDINREKMFFDGQCPQRFKQSSLDSLDRQPPALIRFGKAWARNPESLMLYGGVGCGKTQFAFALIREFIRCRPDLWPRFYTSPDLDSKLLEAIMAKNEGHLISELSKQDLLVIDDFGRETKSDRIKRQYFEIINERYAENLPTIITTNYDSSWIQEQLGEAIASRFETFQWVRFTGKDLRKQEIII